VSNGGRLVDGTAAHTSKRARLYRALHQQASDRGIRLAVGKRLVRAEPTPDDGSVRSDPGSTPSRLGSGKPARNPRPPDEGDSAMELIVTTFVTMDGVMQGPGGAQEDTSNGFDQGRLPPFVDHDFGEIVDAWAARADEFLLGRTTYDMMYPYWSQLIVTDPEQAGVTGQQLNTRPKHIVSRTLRSPAWANASVLDGDVVAGDRCGLSAGCQQRSRAHPRVAPRRLVPRPP
jgi:hypothetical protein